jgi:Glycine cleavage system T protein (aminomethyltransferase)
MAASIGADGSRSAHGIANAGYRAIESLRLEKGYRAWGSDIGPDHTPLEAASAGR